MTPTLTVGITTKNRPASLNAGLASIGLLSHLHPDVFVYDDASSPAAESQLSAEARAIVTRVLRDDEGRGYIVGRNALMREARTPYVLLMDDDARLIAADAIERAIGVLDGDPAVAAVAFAQTELDGRPWPTSMQPSPATRPVLVRTFIGFAHLIRRDAFLAAGGYREAFEFYGEEKELCLRLFDAGLRVVYLPDALVVHSPDPAGRDRVRYLRRVSRNDCLTTLYNDPITRVVWMLPARYALYFRMRRGWGIPDPWGGLWLARDLVRRLPSILRDRRPVSRRTIAGWTALKHETPYTMPVSGPASLNE
ncbi:MAG: glycosyltransferase family 2 protein [Vicinamibacterales bacterium]